MGTPAEVAPFLGAGGQPKYSYATMKELRKHAADNELSIAPLAYANRAVPGDRIAVACATVFPSMTTRKIVCAQIATGVFGGP